MWYLCSGNTWAKPSAVSINSAHCAASRSVSAPNLLASTMLAPSPSGLAVSRAMAFAGSDLLVICMIVPGILHAENRAGRFANNRVKVRPHARNASILVPAADDNQVRRYFLCGSADALWNAVRQNPHRSVRVSFLAAAAQSLVETVPNQFGGSRCAMLMRRRFDVQQANSRPVSLCEKASRIKDRICLGIQVHRTEDRTVAARGPMRGQGHERW